MKVLLAPTEDFIKRARAAITADAEAGSTMLQVPDTALFLVEFAVLGIEGSDNAEMVSIASGDGENTLTISALRNKHLADEPLTAYRYDKRKFYGSTTINGSYVELSSYGSPVDIGVNNPQGTLLEYTGSEGYAYFKATYFNSFEVVESSIADANAVSGDESTRYCSIYAIRKQTGLTNNPYITDGLLEVYRKRAENEVDSYLNARYILPLTNSQGILEIPWMVENVTVLLAAGYIDYQEMGQEGPGVKWLGEARSILKKLQTPGGQQLLGFDKMEMATKTLSNGIQSSPDDSDCEGPVFRMGQQF